MATAVEVSRWVREPVQRMLWGRSAGRCALCNKVLWRSPLSNDEVNLAEKAHIYSFSERGPRGNKGVDPELINELCNLLLACGDCHLEIDKKPDGGKYSVPWLQRRKADHEQRVERVTGIKPASRSHIVLYGVNIGPHRTALSYSAAAEALFENDKFPADDRAIELGVVNASEQDDDAAFWENQTRELERKISLEIRQRLAKGEVEHLSVFGLAPQPLLIRLGCLLTDIPEVDVYQRHREPPTWVWQDGVSEDFSYEISEPADLSGTPALVLSLSASVSPDRIAAVLGSGASIWEISIDCPHNDFLRSSSQLAQFRQIARSLLGRIKRAHGQGQVLHIFPAAPVATCIELGRVRQGKADMPWRIYDQNNQLGGFVAATDLQAGGTT